MKYFTKPQIDSVAFYPKEKIQRALKVINPYLENVEERIRQQAHEFDPAIEGYVTYVCGSHGKRLRPAIALLAGGATGNINVNHINLAVILELIHLASLIHDDIIDGAEIRRDQPTANARWGNTISVLLGDCLFAHALKLSAAFPSAEISKRIADTVTEICSGEILQTQRRFDLKLNLLDYYKIIEMKTASLFATAAELGAIVSEADPKVVQSLEKFGLKIGTAYQIYDDCIDIAGTEQSAGKTLGSDLHKGKLTLPLINLLISSDEIARQRFSDIIVQGEPEAIQKLIEIVCQGEALKQSAMTARKLVAEAQECLEILPENAFSNGLIYVCEYLMALLQNF